MSCGCVGTCGCNIVSDDGNIGVALIGNTFHLTAPGAVQNTFIQEADPGVKPYPYVWWELDNLGNLVTTWVFTP